MRMFHLVAYREFRKEGFTASAALYYARKQFLNYL